VHPLLFILSILSEDASEDRPPPLSPLPFTTIYLRFRTSSGRLRRFLLSALALLLPFRGGGVGGVLLGEEGG
jgi:hypothetical protein